MPRTEVTPHQTGATAHLTCGCELMFDPPTQTGAHIMCLRHGPVIVDVGDTDWSYSCPRCKMSRRYGKDEDRTRSAARGHARNYSHTVVIKHAGKVVGYM